MSYNELFDIKLSFDAIEEDDKELVPPNESFFFIILNSASSLNMSHISLLSLSDRSYSSSNNELLFPPDAVESVPLGESLLTVLPCFTQFSFI